MTTTKLLLSTLKAFHLDRPEATWDELREHLQAVAEEILQTSTPWESLSDSKLVYGDLEADLRAIGMTHGLSVDQMRAVAFGKEILNGAQRRLEGDPRGLVEVIGKLNEPEGSNRQSSINPYLSVGPLNGSPNVDPNASPNAATPNDDHGLTFRALSEEYLAEIANNVTLKTLAAYRSQFGTLSDALGDLDLRTHSRDDMASLRARLLSDPETGITRRSSTVNGLLTRLSSVLDWALATGKLSQAYHKKLKITGKSITSTRKAFTRDQLRVIMERANSLPHNSWERWGVSLGVITGARLNELRQLTGEDVREVSGVWFIDINDQGEKHVKTPNSIRAVPLTDGALGFSLQEFLGYVQSLPEGAPLFPYGRNKTGEVLNDACKVAVGAQEGDGEGLVFHSLRHSLASMLKEHDVSISTAGAILGHSSQSITFDLYGGGQRVGLERLRDALSVAFEVPRS